MWYLPDYGQDVCLAAYPLLFPYKVGDLALSTPTRNSSWYRYSFLCFTGQEKGTERAKVPAGPFTTFFSPFCFTSGYDFSLPFEFLLNTLNIFSVFLLSRSPMSSPRKLLWGRIDHGPLEIWNWPVCRAHFILFFWRGSLETHQYYQFVLESHVAEFFSNHE